MKDIDENNFLVLFWCVFAIAFVSGIYAISAYKKAEFEARTKAGYVEVHSPMYGTHLVKQEKN